MLLKTLVFNWKMNPDSLEKAQELITIYEKCLASNGSWSKLIVVPPTILITDLKNTSKTQISFGVQDISDQEVGAWTGQTSGKLVANLGAEYAVIGHSESRQFLGYSNETINNKVRQCLVNNITPILCIGYEYQPSSNIQANLVELEEQLRIGLQGVDWNNTNLPIIAWEPVWAVGSGKAASLDQINQTHLFIKQTLAQIAGEKAQSVAILYGGSVNPGNVGELYQSELIDGFLVGGASLKHLEAKEIIQFNKNK